MPPNPMRGEADLGGHRLVVDFNRLCALEASLERTVPELVVMMQTGVGFGFRELRAYVLAFLEKPMSEEQAGDLIARAGMVEIAVPEGKRRGGRKTEKTWRAAVALTEAFEGFFAPQKEANENPPLAA